MHTATLTKSIYGPFYKESDESLPLCSAAVKAIIGEEPRNIRVSLNRHPFKGAFQVKRDDAGSLGGFFLTKFGRWPGSTDTIVFLTSADLHVGTFYARIEPCTS